jgi:hypothetical protein
MRSTPTQGRAHAKHAHTRQGTCEARPHKRARTRGIRAVGPCFRTPTKATPMKARLAVHIVPVLFAATKQLNSEERSIQKRTACALKAMRKAIAPNDAAGTARARVHAVNVTGQADSHCRSRCGV